jgi:hypothetical protein
MVEIRIGFYISLILATYSLIADVLLLWKLRGSEYDLGCSGFKDEPFVNDVPSFVSPTLHVGTSRITLAKINANMDYSIFQEWIHLSIC